MIEIEQSCIEFDLSNKSKNKFDSFLSIKNVFNQFVAIRIKTTKKDIYAVSPTYVVLSPNQVTSIAIVYFRKDNAETDISKHKFKIEAIVADKLLPENEIKNFFDLVIAKGQKVQGTTIKKRVYHKNTDVLKPTTTIDESSVSQSQSQVKSVYVNPSNNLTGQAPSNPLIEEKKPRSSNDILTQSNIDQQVFQSIPPQTVPLQNSYEVERLKKELSKSMIYLTNLKEEQKIKKRELDMLSKGSGAPHGFAISEVEIKKGISPKVCLIGFIVFFLLGYYLSK